MCYQRCTSCAVADVIAAPREEQVLSALRELVNIVLPALKS